MNREIKYKAWNGEEISKPCTIFSDNSFIFNNSENIFVNDADYNQLKILEYIGLQDKWGQEIYTDYIVIYKEARGFVFYSRDDAMYMVRFPLLRINYSFDSMEEKVEIIGNIHEDPYFLE